MSLSRTIIALGLVAMFAVLLFGDTAPALPTVSNLPEFDNPFNARTAYLLQPDADLDTDPPATAIDEFETGGTGVDDPTCDTGNAAFLAGAGEFWGCLTNRGEPEGPPRPETEPDDFQTRVTLGPGNNAFTVSLEAKQGGSGDNYVSSLRVHFQCNGASITSVGVVFSFQTAAGVPFGTDSPEVRCKPNVWADYIADYGIQLADPSGVAPITTSDFNNARLIYQDTGREDLGVGSHLVSQLYVEIEYSAARVCTGGFAERFWCQGEQMFAFSIMFGQGIMNAFAFIFEWAAFIFDYIISIFEIIAWLYAIPGMPLPLQVFVDVFITAMAVTIIVEVARMIRG